MITKDKYEISLWEDFLVPATFSEDGQTILVPEHYEEEKIAIIGGDSLSAPYRAVEPRMVENINGSNVFSFKMYLKYVDTLSGEKFDNPFLNLLVNERKVKVLWKNKWYDLIIKNIEENSVDKSLFYTCKDLYINELSKTGFNLIFDNELENNQGNIIELGEKIVKNTDWVIDKTNCDFIQQTIEDSVYEKQALNSFSINSIGKIASAQEIVDTQKIVKKNDKFLLFYSNFNGLNIKYREEKTFYKGISYYTKDEYGFYHLEQIDSFANNVTYYVKDFPDTCIILYDEKQNYLVENNSTTLLNNDNYEVKITWKIKTDSNGFSSWGAYDENNNLLFSYSELEEISLKYKGNKLVKLQKTEYFPLLKQYLNVYELNPSKEKIYGFIDEEYRTADSINNLLVNTKMFSSNKGWINDPELMFNLYPQFDKDNAADYLAKSYLKLTKNSYFNRGLQETRIYLPDGFQEGQRYVFRIKAHPDVEGKIDIDKLITGNFYPRICEYTSNESKNNEVTDSLKYTPKEGTDYFTVPTEYQEIDGFYEMTLTCIKSIPRTHIGSTRMGFFLERNSNSTVWLEEVQFFEELYGIDEKGNPKRVNPGQLDVSMMFQKKYKYFSPATNEGITKPEEIVYIYNSYEDLTSENLIPIYTDNYEKIRSITAKNSNRFNLLQSLAETFQCWVDFNIEHEKNGKIKIENGTPKKTVSFKLNKGQRVDYGFIYGIDLKGIQRTIESDQIATKVIVTPNDNKYAPNGSCNIEDSPQNYSKQSFILNFDYYFYKNLLREGQLKKDLYLTTPDSLGYYYYLNLYTTKHKKVVEDLIVKKNELLKMESYQTVYEEHYSASVESIIAIETELLTLANVKTIAAAADYVKANPNNTKVANILTNLSVQKANATNYLLLLKNLEKSILSLKDYIKKLETEKEGIEKDIDKKELDFFKKYGRFIQEGSWTQDSYFDPTLYYLDALHIANTSAKPKISYNISVLRLSSLEEFKNKVFHLGDISFIEDTEFFGYVKNIYDTVVPYKEKVLISEIVSYFDTPNQDSFKIQNYKTQFEDLFQRITATTQNLQYSSGQYQRAADGFTQQGIINGETLQSSIARNEDLVYSAKNDIIIQDSTGITLTDSTDPSKKTKVTSGGIFISTDGGATWKNAVRGEGIATQYLTAGNINVNNINLYDGNHKTFRWDEKGLNAFSANKNDGVLLSKFVRFDQYGLYGINSASGTDFDPNDLTKPGDSNLVYETPQAKIWDNAFFGLTWDKFFMKSLHRNGGVEISSNRDIEVTQNGISRIHIGALSQVNETDDYVYGIQINDAGGLSVLETDADGQLWLKNKLEIGTYDGNNHVSIGKLGKATEKGKNRVIDANNNFIVYEDGSIYATSGTIGNMNISDISNLGYNVIILSDVGNIIKDENKGPDEVIATLTTEIYYRNNTSPEPVKNFTYQWFNNDIQIVGADSNVLEIKNSYFHNKEVIQVTCKVTLK